MQCGRVFPEEKNKQNKRKNAKAKDGKGVSSFHL